MSSEIDQPEITAKGVREAAARLSGHVVHTPLIENEQLNEIAGGRVLVKAEVLQHCGSFKYRGAFNLVSKLTAEELERGILGWSSGNHAQGVARAARHFGANALIVMPEDAPALKVEKVRAFGAEIVTYDRYTEDREEIARSILSARDMVLAPSYDHPDIIEGQGTLALEVLEDAGADIEAFIICCGGGGLTSGCAVLLEEASPDTEVWIAEPEGFDESWASIKSGERCHADISQRTICDAIATPTPGRLTLPIMQRLVRGGVGISEQEVRDAMEFAFKYLKLVVEPGGAVALAAVLTGKFPAAGKTTAITLSGGNVDPGLFVSLIGRAG